MFVVIALGIDIEEDLVCPRSMVHVPSLLFFTGAKLWNTLPANISDIDKLQSIKVATKSHFIKGLIF